MAFNGDYSTGPYVALRVHKEEGWVVDAVDANGDYSEAIWDVYDGERMTQEKAIAVAPEFAREYGIPADLPVRVIDS